MLCDVLPRLQIFFLAEVLGEMLVYKIQVAGVTLPVAHVSFGQPFMNVPSAFRGWPGIRVSGQIAINEVPLRGARFVYLKVASAYGTCRMSSAGLAKEAV
ncbi:hypothetical protein GCM10010279_16640 [Streptomyces mutabilis]|jgi:hypothetical protein|nr:hypothetical protein GCM10010279_16640 [Streptomyces mutabilis]